VIWFSTLALAVDRTRRLLGPHLQHRLERISGAIMVGFGLKLATKTR
jgi:threonine/homoserine/homoserine lactone efflux protein